MNRRRARGSGGGLGAGSRAGGSGGGSGAGSGVVRRFFFKSQVIGTNKFKVGKCEDHVWVTKDELMEYFPEQVAFLNQMIIS
ncbi:hypothetical protein MRB53_028622 [Persea americana]|uniref:Uncharacterized protein n=1 Tax=Persea americana TaxID=3435 RepID=A0ACC2KG89_PERAE|nr:hypothetical protein MRB53_028622 [Persea americana]